MGAEDTKLPPERSDQKETAIIGPDARETPLPEGTRVGAYRILRELGHGGMGAVYLAVRADEQYEQSVAIKIIKRGMDTDEIVLRFRRERQILARLDHPNIAKLMDGGTTEGGLPYFVMEYIRGVPLHDYCNTHNLDVMPRLKLFLSVCSAVQYAHQNLVVHRDLKPGNILVTEDGTPKLLDFGLAKVLTPQSEQEAELLTASQVRLMTPEYASPEQARGDPITTATDVYSLGIVLYELLTQRRPYRFTSREPHAVLQIISDHEPAKPSSAITRQANGAGVSSGISPRKLRRQLKGDLDNVVMTALRKEPERRYASAQVLSQDIRAYIGGMPVLARKPTPAYRAGKFVRRHTTAVAVALVVIIALAAFAVNLAIQSKRLARERDVAARERDRAEQVSAFLTHLFGISDPSEARGNTITAREILDRGSKRINTELKGQPEVRAALLDTMGGVYQSLGIYDRADSLLEQALKTRRKIYGNEHADVAESLNALASLRLDSGDFESAERLYREAVEIRRKLFGNDNLKVADSLTGLALIYHDKGNYGAAEPIYREALRINREQHPGPHAELATAIGNLALLLHDKGDLKAAEPLYREALSMNRNVLGEDHPDVARGLNNLASLLQDKGDYATAEPLFREVLALDRKLFGPEHPEVATALNNLGRILQDKGDDAAAEPLFREAVAMDLKLLGKGHPNVIRLENNLATLLYETGRPEEAEPLLREVLASYRSTLESDHPLIVSNMYRLGCLLQERGDCREAVPLLQESYEKLKALKAKSADDALRRLNECRKEPPGEHD